MEDLASAIVATCGAARVVAIESAWFPYAWTVRQSLRVAPPHEEDWEFRRTARRRANGERRHVGCVCVCACVRARQRRTARGST